VAKVLVSFEDRLLRRIDRKVKARALTRSAYLSQLAEGDLDSESGPGGSPMCGLRWQRLIAYLLTLPRMIRLLPSALPEMLGDRGRPRRLSRVEVVPRPR
jgi:hypothetical protein